MQVPRIMDSWFPFVKLNLKTELSVVPGKAKRLSSQSSFQQPPRAVVKLEQKGGVQDIGKTWGVYCFGMMRVQT
jgi:hypothetical protein